MTEVDPALDRARERARELRDFYTHLVTYVLVNSLLVVIDLLGGKSGHTILGLDWAYWPIMGWGIGILLHAFNTFVSFRDWEERKAQQIYQQTKDR